MPSSADDARAAVARTIVALERSCLEADAAFVERRWPDVDAALREQTALTAELARLFAGDPAIAPPQDAKVARRVHGVYAYREEQLRRMRAYRDDVRERLQAIGKMNALSRSIGRGAPRMGVVDGFV